MNSLVIVFVHGWSVTNVNTYGELPLRLKPSKKFNLNLNEYYYTAHRQYDISDATATHAWGDIKAKLLVNFKAAWHATSQINMFINGRNIVNIDTYESFSTDRIGGLYLAGLSFSLN